MGLDPGYPAARINDPTASVPIWNGHRTIIGYLGPDDSYHSAGTNITCFISRLNGSWYKLLNPNGWDLPADAAYVSTRLTHLMLPGPPDYTLGSCRGNRDQPGLIPWWLWVIAAGALIAAMSVLRRGRSARRSRVDEGR